VTLDFCNYEEPYDWIDPENEIFMCTIMGCNNKATHYISKDVRLCDYCYAGDYK